VARSKKFWLLLEPEIEKSVGITVGDAVSIKVVPGTSP
jgi:hypothetical protein